MNKTYPLGGWVAPGTKVSWQRSDQGQDFVLPWRGIIQAPGAGHVVAVGADRAFPNGFGPSYPWVAITTGRWAGHTWYLGHTTSLVHPGQKFTFGTPLARADQGHPSQIGISVPGDGGWLELGEILGGRVDQASNHHWYHLLFRNLPVKVPDPVYRYGSQGWGVLRFTRLLQEAGYLTRPWFHFNRPVHGAVIKFQHDHKLKADGIVGPTTWLAIQHAAKAKKGKK